MSLEAILTQAVQSKRENTLGHRKKGDKFYLVLKKKKKNGAWQKTKDTFCYSEIKIRTKGQHKAGGTSKQRLKVLIK